MVSKEKWRLLWTLILGTPHIGANVTVTLSLVPITLHLPPSLQISQSATQCMMTQKCSSACNTPYNLRCVVSYHRHLLISTRLGKQEHQCLQSTGAR